MCFYCVYLCGQSVQAVSLCQHTSHHLPDDVWYDHLERIRDWCHLILIWLPGQCPNQELCLFLDCRHHLGLAHTQVPQLSQAEPPVVMPNLPTAWDDSCKRRYQWLYLIAHGSISVHLNRLTSYLIYTPIFISCKFLDCTQHTQCDWFIERE